MQQGLSANHQGLMLMVKHNKQIARRFAQSVRPVMDYLGCSFMHMGYTTASGRTWAMHTHPDMMHYWLIEADGFLQDPLFSDFTLWHPSVFVWPTYPDGQFKDRLNQGMSECFDITSGISFCFQKNNELYSVALGCTQDHPDFINAALQEHALMDQICQFVFDDMEQDIETLKRQYFPAAEYARGRYTVPQKINPKTKEERIKMLLATRQIEVTDLALLKTSLSDRERQCAYWFLQGCNIEQVAHTLGLAAGSVRSHLHRIKQRFGVDRKVALIDCLRKLELMSYFNNRDQFTAPPETRSFV